MKNGDTTHSLSLSEGADLLLAGARVPDPFQGGMHFALTVNDGGEGPYLGGEAESGDRESKESRTVVRPAAEGSEPIRVLIVDDHEVVRKGLSACFSETNDFLVVGQTGSPSLAILLVRQLQPDIVLLDIVLGEVNGLDIAQRLLRAAPGTRIVVFTGYHQEVLLFRAMRIGVHGYLQKSASLETLLEALRSVYLGERVLGNQQEMTQVLGEFGRLTREQERARSGLTDLEIELLRLAAEGCSNKEIAARQFWSEVTVKRKMQDIYRKLQVTDRAQAVAEAMRMGLI
jgi:DNA-binding NarL/FixJ family response regulator